MWLIPPTVIETGQTTNYIEFKVKGYNRFYGYHGQQEKPTNVKKAITYKTLLACERTVIFWSRDVAGLPQRRYNLGDFHVRESSNISVNSK